MTSRVSRDVPVDWQVKVRSGANPASAHRATAAEPGTKQALLVGFGTSKGFTATSSGNTSTTGAGVVLGLPGSYVRTFPGEVRLLAGSMRPGSVLLAQQTAANLHAQPGSLVRIGRSGLPSARVRVGGVVELPAADVLFHTIGAPPSAQPTAPPDNVMLLPADLFHRLFAPLAKRRPDLVSWQVHASRIRPLANDPATAYTQSTQAAHHFEAKLAGAGIVGDDLGDALAAAREDAAYAQVLFLFLGVPGVAVALLLTVSVAAAGGERRRREQALLRTRGASSLGLLSLAAAEGLVSGGLGVIAGLGAAALLGRFSFGSVGYGATPAQAIAWAGAATVVGLATAVSASVLPCLRAARTETVASMEAAVGRRRPGAGWVLPLAAGLCVAVGALVVRLSSGNNYQLVLAPEGAPAISVNYWAFIGPALLWVGGGLGVWALTVTVLTKGRRLVGAAARPVTGPLAGTAAAVLARQAGVIARGTLAVALALSFAATTAVLTTTYARQALVDAQLTNGADVAVTKPSSSRTGPSFAHRIASVPGVQAVEPLQHRFAYVGSDLQDFYGVRPATLRRATTLQDSYFQGGTARSVLAALTTHRDGVLVSAETVNDYQLHVGDAIRLRLQDARTGRYRTVPFHYVGIVAEFPTAPRDSFLVANADYVAAKTGSNAVGTFLVRAGRSAAPAVASRLRHTLGPTAHVVDVQHVHTTIGSTLTSVDISGLARIELAAAVALVVSAAGAVLALGLVERRRTAAVAAVLGARRRQLRGLVAVEAAAVLGIGVITATGLSFVIAPVLVTVLNGVFDPPPEHAFVPGGYLALLLTAAVVATGVAALAAATAIQRDPLPVLREEQQ
ncbi:putative ABC transport system permease protein [Actinopolymorpha rutila]|uniref:Putative ABC transport system permease protein n=2 Tax=Actinopolymorpha rutila TaxID=446787 RepID=A0A852ZDY3_9ACTN|nr:putative ABC transport system permease protein [Actinopolymorpha rutila]